MSKIGVELKIDVTKIDKERLFKGEKGTYLTMTAFIDLENQGQYGDNGMITHKKDKDEERAPILGNATIFWKDGGSQPVQNNVQQSPPSGGFDDFDNSDIPF